MCMRARERERVIQATYKLLFTAIFHPITLAGHVGRIVYDLATKHGKRVQCNMGAKNHAVIMPDAHQVRILKFAISSIHTVNMMGN